MPAQEISHRRQKALLWALTGYAANGQATVALLSSEIKVRWTDRQIEMLNPQGVSIKVDATLIVAQDVAVGSILWKGGYEALAATLPGTGTADATDVPLSGLFQAVAFDDAEDVKGRVNQRTVGLMRWGDAMPTQAV